MAGLSDFISNLGRGEQNVQIAPHPEDEQLHSSVNEVQNLEETFAWRDMEQLMDERINHLQNALVKMDDPVEIRRLQGAIEAWQSFKELPELLIDYLKQQRIDQNGRNS